MTDHAEITTRIAVSTDADSVVRIAHDAYAHYTSRIGRAPAPMIADYVDLIAQGTVRVAESGDELLGLLVLVDRPDHLLLDNIAVGPSAQGRGVGALLLELTEREAARRRYA